MILGVFFLKISNANVLFGEKKHIQKSYITIKAPYTIKRIQIVDPKKFIMVALDANS